MIISTRAFLAHVLPTEGYYCCVTFPFSDPKNPRQYFTPNLDQLVERILLDDSNGHTVYHACCTYASPGRRTQDNARFARSLWLDIDAGPGKDYGDADDAAEHVLDFCEHAGMPHPLLVNSGRGLHCYWPLEKMVGVDEWQILASGLRDLCDRHGLSADHVRTCDCASILRPHGTVNRKSGETRAVLCR